ncbi:MAG: hypothetical protein AB1640_16955 [bacterium]
MHQALMGRIFKVGLTSVLLAGLWGCGGGGDDPANGSPGLLYSDLQDLDTTIQSHVETVEGVLGTGARSVQQEAAAVLTPADWEALRAESVDYSTEMNHMLGSLGEDVTSAGDCQISYGGMMYGPPDSGGSCPCQSYLDGIGRELDRHLRDMSSWMDQHDPSGLWQEMIRHRDRMRSHITDMGSHMEHLYGHDGWMDGWDEGHMDDGPNMMGQ